MLIVIIILLSLTVFLKYEQKLMFIKYIPETINKSINYVFDDYQVTIPLHKFAFIENYDISLKPSVKYFTFLDVNAIKEFYTVTKQNAERNYKTYNDDNIIFYLDTVNNTYVQIPDEYYIEDKNIFFRQVRFNIIDNETMKKIIEK